jgi:hypothetical protein
VNISAGAPPALPYYGTALGNVVVSASWGGCEAVAEVQAFHLLTARYDHSMLALAVGQAGGLAISLNGLLLTLNTNQHASCYAGYPFFRPAQGTLALLKQPAVWLTPGGDYYADFFGFDNLQVAGALAPADALALFRGAYPGPPPPPGASTEVYSYLANDALVFTACGAAPPAHWYGAYALSFSEVPGALADLAGDWLAQRVDAPDAGGDSGANGTLVIALPPGADNETAAVASGCTARLLLSPDALGAPIEISWLGLSFAMSSGGAAVMANSYAGSQGSAKGAGTLTQPYSPFSEGLYTTLVWGPEGSAIYVGPYLWASFPAVVWVPGQGLGTAACSVALGSNLLFDLQVYDYAFTGAQVVAAAQGAAC